MSVQQILDWKGDRLITVSCGSILSDISEILSTENIGTVILTDEVGKPVGLLSERDIIRAIAPHGGNIGNVKAVSIMTNAWISCTPETSLSDVLALMSTNAILDIPVMCGDELMGLVRLQDVLDFQRQLVKADIDRRSEDAQALQEAYDTLEAAFNERAEDVQIARREAENANQTKTEFLANMSHELRTPLNAIIGFSEIMDTQAFGPIGSPRYREYATDIHESGQHLLSLINDLLDLSKVESGKAELYEESIVISYIAQSALKMLQNRADKQGITIETEFEDNPPTLWADKRKVKQILTNLFTNAVKFTNAGGTVTVRIWCKPETGYIIQVADTGIGISPKDIPIALSHFGQIDIEHRREREGTGLGLPLTKALVELHGGYLDMQSTVGVGTTVTIRFPASRIETVALRDAGSGIDGLTAG